MIRIGDLCLMTARDVGEIIRDCEDAQGVFLHLVDATGETLLNSHLWRVNKDQVISRFRAKRLITWRDLERLESEGAAS
jgi:hypothetical protein